jgi:hypothetical protein
MPHAFLVFNPCRFHEVDENTGSGTGGDFVQDPDEFIGCRILVVNINCHRNWFIDKMQ